MESNVAPLDKTKLPTETLEKLRQFTTLPEEDLGLIGEMAQQERVDICELLQDSKMEENLLDFNRAHEIAKRQNNESEELAQRLSRGFRKNIIQVSIENYKRERQKLATVLDLKQTPNSQPLQKAV